RLWVASSEYTADVRISQEIMAQTAENYRKIRNTFRFLLGNVADFNPEKDRIPYEQMPEIDQIMMNLLNNLIDKVVNAYENYRFDEVYRSILSYMTNELSAFYCDFTKDVLYIEVADNPERRSIQTVFYENLSALVRLLTPIIPHTTEEVYSHMPYEKEESVYLTNMPKSLRYANGAVLLNKYEMFKDLRSDVLKALEEARSQKIIGKSLASKVVLKPSETTLKLLNSMKVDWAKVFIVSEFAVTSDDIDGTEYKSGIIQITARQGHVCSRCWKVVDEVNEDELCNRCSQIIKKMRS
ncbi:MAG TPA: class I tRNA ligase family protein, partial [Bacilli bacterium]